MLAQKDYYGVSNTIFSTRASFTNTRYPTLDSKQEQAMDLLLYLTVSLWKIVGFSFTQL